MAKNRKHTTYYCNLYTQLDALNGTSKNSPLHHDNRCPIHNEKATKKREALMQKRQNKLGQE